MVLWFKSKEEKEREEQKEQAKELAWQQRREASTREINRRDEILARVGFTPESKENYEKRVGYAVEVIDTLERDKGVIFEKDGSRYRLLGDSQLEIRLVNAGIEAVVETSISFRSKTESFGHGNYMHVKTEIDMFYYGLPVARKKGGPYR